MLWSRSPAFKSYTVYYNRTYRTWFHYGYFATQINLANSIHSLARFSKRMMLKALCIPTSYYNYLISDSFSLPFSGIFSTFSHDTILYRSWLVFSFRGLWPLFSNPDVTEPYSWINFIYVISIYVTITHLVEFSNSFIFITLRLLLLILPHN